MKTLTKCINKLLLLDDKRRNSVHRGNTKYRMKHNADYNSVQ